MGETQGFGLHGPYFWPTTSLLSVQESPQQGLPETVLAEEKESSKLLSFKLLRCPLPPNPTHAVVRVSLGTNCTACAQAQANYTGTVLKTLFCWKTCKLYLGEQMAGVFTLNMKLIQACVCEALSSFIRSVRGLL